MKVRKMVYWVIATVIVLLAFYFGSMFPYSPEAYNVNSESVDQHLVSTGEIASISSYISDVLWNKMVLVSIIVALVTLSVVSAITLYFRGYKGEE